MMFLILASQLERVGFLIAMLFFLLRLPKLRQFMQFRGERRNLWIFILLFSFFAVLGTYSGVRVTGDGYSPQPWTTHISGFDAISTNRTIGVVIAGLFGGVRAGLMVGIIAGIHRYSLGGFVNVACMVAPILEGIFAGLMKSSLKRRFRHLSSVQLSFLVGFVAESLQMGLILLLAHPFDEALRLVSLIALPQILSNSLGVAAFFAMLIQVEREEERIGAHHAGQALQIAEMTLSYWREPLPKAVAKIGQALIQGTEAIGVTFLKDGQILFKDGKTTFHKLDLPIKYRKKLIGYFRLFYESDLDKKAFKNTTILRGLSQLFSQQYALAEAERQKHLVTRAEIKALQAQMDPHFLFNALNTIKSLIRTSPEEARKMITKLGKYLRKNMQNINKDLITIREELEHVQFYLDFVKVRMGDRLQVEWKIDEKYLDYSLPPLTIQPLVENAIVHGFKNINRKGLLIISIGETDKGLLIKVCDNGAGMERNLVDENKEEHMGFALSNIQERLIYHYGEKVGLSFETQKGKGTTVSFIRPI
jgi:two-component system sensor histidine kinase LytS